MATVDEDLNQLEKDIRQLKIEFEQYFGGGRPRPPNDTIWRIEQMIKRYGEMGARISFAQRFRYNNLAQTFAKYQDVFRKRMKQKEEGYVHKSYGSAARTLEAERSRREAAEAAAAPPPAAAAAGAQPRRGEVTMAWSDPDREGDKVQQLYQALVEAKQKAGEKTEGLTLESFQQFVRNKTAQLKQQKQGADQVEYSVSLEGGQVKLKARVKS
jgi:hypothetical protein